MILILAAGMADRWKGPKLKQLTLIDGEPLIARTVRQLDELGMENVVVTHEPGIMEVVPRYIVPEQGQPLPAALLSGRHLWEGRTWEFHGDVLWDPKALSITLSGSGLHFYGSRKGKWENFAFGFDPEHYDIVEAACERVIEWGKTHDRAGSWEIYRAIVGMPLVNIREFESKVWTEVKPGGEDSDYTQDFDTLKDYEYFLERWRGNE